MAKFEKIADIRARDWKVVERLIKILENAGFSICLDGPYGIDQYDFVVMEKNTSNEN